jgi:hypothetical protein
VRVVEKTRVEFGTVVSKVQTMDKAKFFRVTIDVAIDDEVERAQVAGWLVAAQMERRDLVAQFDLRDEHGRVYI